MISVGNIIEGKVTSVMPFGAFVDLGNNQSGLVHISEISNDYVKDINERISKGDTVKVKVINVDEKGRISLSIKKASEPKSHDRHKFSAPKNGHSRPADIDWSHNDGELSFEDKMQKFKQDSDEKIQALKRSADSKRSGGYSRKGGFSY